MALQLGDVFHSLSEFNNAQKKFQQKNNVLFCKKSSKKLADYHPGAERLIYDFIHFECKQGKKRASASKGIRPNQSTFKCGCKAYMRISVQQKEGVYLLKITGANHNHTNHPVDALTALVYPENRRLAITNNVGACGAAAVVPKKLQLQQYRCIKVSHEISLLDQGVNVKMEFPDDVEIDKLEDSVRLNDCKDENEPELESQSSLQVQVTPLTSLSSSTVPHPQQRNRDRNADDGDLLQCQSLACPRLSEPMPNPAEDQFDLYGKNIAHRLRNLSLEQRVHAQKHISDILYEAELGLLSRPMGQIYTPRPGISSTSSHNGSLKISPDFVNGVQ